jgi:23S rRNA (uracil-5-)-methyltransferase RumA
VVTCPHYQECGGCDFRDLPYVEQLAYKQRYVHNLLTPFNPVLEPIIASPVQDHYRNKMEFVVARVGDEVRIGQRRKNCFNAVVDISACPIFHARAGGICGRVKQWVSACNCPVYDLQKGGKGLRYITLRHAKAGDGLMMTITSAGELPGAEAFAAELVASGVAASVYLCANDAVSDRAVATGTGELRCVAGAEFIRETVNGVSYRIYPQTFFQTNPFCCADLYTAVLRCLDEGKADRQAGMIDLFCGSGGIGLQLAAAGFSVTGIDNVKENCRCAGVNAEDNGLKNARFVCSDAQVYLEEMSATGALEQVGGLVVDPPRQGLTKHARAMLAGSGIPLIVYVSCNPLTLAQDLKVLSASYRVEKCIPVDMFPHTRHIETIVKLKARDGSQHG